MKKLIVFDLDGTLALSKSPLDAVMGALLQELLGLVKVAVISGGRWLQFETQLLANLQRDDRLLNLVLLPACGTKYFEYMGEWKMLYSEDFTPDEKKKIVAALTQAITSAGIQVAAKLGAIQLRIAKPDHIFRTWSAGSIGRKAELGS